MPKTKRIFEYRHYEMPLEACYFTLLGDHWIRQYDNREQEHFHNYLEIGFCHQGTGTLSIDQQLYEYGPGSFSWIPAFIPHATNSTPGELSYWEYIFLDIKKLWGNFSPALYFRYSRKEDTLTGEENPFFVSGQDARPFQELLIRILEDNRNPDTYASGFSQALLMAVSIEILRLQKKKNDLIQPGFSKAELLVLPALQRVAETFHQGIRIVDLAICCHMSESHFRRIFQECVGVAPLEYLNHVRIREACTLMQTTALSLYVIAERCGFGSISSFNRNFLAIMGLTPSGWRSQPKISKRNPSNFKVYTMDGWR